jgi:hypothetical protein
MRPALVFAILLCLLLTLDGALLAAGQSRRKTQEATLARLEMATRGLGLTDLAVATEARYTRHPAVSDPLAPFMDHPGAIEHFPTGSFWRPVPH